MSPQEARPHADGGRPAQPSDWSGTELAKSDSLVGNQR
jgi:hypothetical protein